MMYDMVSRIEANRESAMDSPMSWFAP